MGVEGSKSTSNDGTSGWEDVEEEDEALARLEDEENGHPMEGVEEGVCVTVSNCSAFLKILLTVSRTSNPWHSNASNPGGNRPHDAVRGFCRPWRTSMLF